MSVKAKVIAAGAVFLVVGLFLYFTIRFDYFERERIGSLVASTNDIVRDYHAMERRMTAEHKTPSSDDLSGFLKAMHKKYPQVALMAITDSALSLRLSSKNDRYIKSAELFESILKDFTQEKFNISRSNPYTVRYYEEKSGGSPEQLRFYIFLSKIGPYRLLVVYPHTVGSPVVTRTALEVALMTMFILILTAAAYIALSKKREPGKADTGRTLYLNLESRAPSGGGSALAGETASIVSDGLGGYVHDLFAAISGSHGTDTASFYIFHPSGRLVKTMELIGKTFLKIDSVSFDTIDIDNEAGRELRNGATIVLEEGRKIIMPLIYNNAFLGAVSLEKRGGLTGSEIGEIRGAIAGVLKNIHDHVMANDVMTDAGTGLNSKIYYNLKYHECVRAWKGRGRDFSLLLIRLFADFDRHGEGEKSGIIKLLAPAMAKSIGDNGHICRLGDIVAVILPDMSSRKARGIEKELESVLAGYRIRISEDLIVQIDPVIGLSSTDTAGPEEDPAAVAMGRISDRSPA